MVEKIQRVVLAHIAAGLSQKRISLNVSAEELKAAQRELEESLPNTITYEFSQVDGAPEGIATLRTMGYTIWLQPE